MTLRACLRHLFSVWALCCLLLPALACAESRVTFHDSIADVPRSVAATQRAVLATREAGTMEFGIALKMRAYEQLQARIARGETLSREELSRVHLPLASDYNAIVAWLTSEGFEITGNDPTRLMVYARGTLKQIQRSLQVHMVTVTANGGRTYDAADTAPSLPLNIATPVLGINHLQPFHQHQKHAVRLPLTNNSPPFKISEILKAYNGLAMGVTGANQKIAILIDTPAKNSDLTQFWSANGITQSTANVEVVNVNNATLAAPSGEESLDEEWTSGIAPGAKIRVYASGSLSDADLDRSLQRLINDLPTQPQIHQLSISLGLGETYVSQAQFLTDQQLFATLASSGVSIFVSSGDGGSTPDDVGGSSGPLQVEHYASDPSVTAVGGTSLTINSSTGARTGESVWSGSGGGVSIQFAKPVWQTGPGVPTGSKRFVPDVALTADPNTGAYVVLNGAVAQYGGTSWSAPMWAGFCALINEARANAGKPALGLMNPSLYPLIGSNNFVDITSGSNATSSSNGKYAATVGYDQATGIGVPHMSNLLGTLSSQALAAPTIASFTPASGVQQTKVVIAGANFSSVSAVAFNAVNASFTVDSPTQITALAPANGGSGPITVTTPGGTASSAGNFSVLAGAAAPAITGLSPGYGPVGTAVVVSGTDFSGATAVGFNGQPAVFVVGASNQITATVPTSASTGPVTVTTPSGTASSPTAFTVLSGDGSPTVASFTPVSGAVGTTVTVTGANFVNVSSVTVGGVVAAAPNVISATQVSFTVPNGATSGPVVITTGLGTATSADNFTVSAGPIPLASFDVSGQTNFGTSPLAASAAANLSVGGLTRGSGVTITGTAAARAWGGNGFTSTSASVAISASDYASFSITPDAGYKVSFSAISKFDYRRSSSGPNAGVLQYQLGNGAFVDVGTLAYATGNAGNALAAIDLRGISALQGVPPGTTVTFRVVNYGASSATGTWYLYDRDNSPAADLVVSGNVEPVVVSKPDLAISKSHAGNFTQGDKGRTYVISVANAGTAPSSGIVTITDTLPSDLTATAMSGSGWTVNLATLTATRSDALGAGSSYPPLTVTVDVAPTAAASLTNVATVAGGGDSTSANNTASDATTVVPPANLSLETAADGSGTSVPAQTVGVGSSLTLFAISRPAGSSAATNLAVDWSLGSATGEVVAGNLVPAADRKSAVFTPYGVGSASVHISAPGTIAQDSGTLTVVAPPSSPAGASQLDSRTAHLGGLYNPSGTPAMVYLEYGPSTAYGFSTPTQDLGAGTQAVSFGFDLSGLQPGTTYHYRMVVVGNGLTTRYADQTFTTPAISLPRIPVPATPLWALLALGIFVAGCGGSGTRRGARGVLRNR
jgi:kumamolisin